MKKLNQNNNLSNTKLLERGGLMIEALAMLGLIAVVTPTMYKKSAERTLEVEDINTATTVRTYMNAVEAYMANEYGTFVSEPDKNAETGAYIQENHTVKKGHFYEDPTKPGDFGSRDGTEFAYYVDNAELANYLPYGFDVNRAMFEYNAPKTRIVKNGNNLTAFVSFPAKNGQADGIGQERTARIASLIGSTGGYKPNSNTARGIGGIWTLTQGEGEGGSTQLSDLGFANDNVYSLVTASANVAMDVNGGQMDNDKYLQRTREDDTNPGSGDEMWRNTMRTDLYLGGHLGNETQTLQAGDNGSKRYSIRNIQSLIVGADTANMVGDVDADGNPVTDADGNQTQSESKKYGLYITGGANEDYANTYIGGTLSALKRGFYVTTGEKIDNAEGDEYAGTQLLIGENDSTDYTTEIRGDGDITNAGANGILLGNFANVSGSTITLGDTPKDDGSVGVGLTLENDGTEMYSYYLGENFEIEDDTHYAANDADSQDSVNIMPNGFRQIPENNETGWANAPTLSNAYKNANKFQVNVGANTIVDGLLAAGQIDTQKIRAANLSVGSANVEDAGKWLNVDENGTIIETPSQMRDTLGHSKLALLNPDDGSTDGIYLRILDSTGRGYDASRKSTFYVDSDGFNYEQTHGNQTGRFSIYVEEDENSTSSLQAGSISLTAQNGSTSEGSKEKGTITLNAKDGVNAEGTAIPGIITAQNSKIKMVMGKNNAGRELTISNAAGSSITHGITEAAADSDFRVHMLGGWLDLENTGFHISRNDNNVFSVGVPDNTGEHFSDYIGDSWTDSDGSDMANGVAYAVATHGPAIFTNYVENGTFPGTNEYVSYLSTGAYLKDAAVSIMADDDTTSAPDSNILVVDMMSGDVDDSITENEDQNKSGAEVTFTGDKETAYVMDGDDFKFRDGTKKIGQGTIYMRRGMLEVLPAKASSLNDEYTASMGGGIVKASRFVANNIDNNGNLIKVPAFVNQSTYNQYYKNDEGDVIGSDGRDLAMYDTYMVNPAYTSVMHDIKLTTRGGARLSDILPDFINKGIYIASNTVKENANNRKMEFELTSSGVTGFGDDTAAGAYDYVSPYMGVVPAPQCPPGYGRVITLNPVSFEMANAGTPRLQKLADDKYTYYTTPEDTMPDAMKDGSTLKLLTNVDESGNPAEGHVMHEHHELMPHQLDIRTPVLAKGAANADGSAADGKNDRAWKNAIDLNSNDKALKLEDDSSAKNFTLTNFQNIATNLRVTTPNTDASSSAGDHIDRPYVLGYATDDINNVFRPLTFQQSTFLKSAAVPLVMGETKKFGDTAASGEYTSGWAVLMGFIYPYDNYKTVIDQLKPNISEFSSYATGFYWNIFPVLRDRLEAYATVYCYFDRNNLYKNNVEPSTGIKHVDPYDYIDSLPTSFKKQSHGDYLERLNDPTMKYNETW